MMPDPEQTDDARKANDVSSDATAVSADDGSNVTCALVRKLKLHINTRPFGLMAINRQVVELFIKSSAETSMVV